jgi:TonB family protein
MIRRRRPLLLAANGILFLTSSLIDSTILQQLMPRASAQNYSPADQNSVSFDHTPMIQFVGKMIERLDIAIVVIDRVNLQGSVTLHKDAPVSRQDLLNLFIDGLSASDAVLVKSGSVMQIVPKSRDLGEGLEPITSPAELEPSSRGGSVWMKYNSAPLSEFAAHVAGLLNIMPIVIKPGIHGSVTLLSSAPITREQVYSILMTVLKNNDALLIESAGQYQIVLVSGDMPQGWKTVGRQPAPPDLSIRRQRRFVKQEELESHILSRVEPALLSTGEHKLTGKVQLEIALNERGELDILHVIEPSVLPLGEAAIEAVRQWRFKPFLDSNGLPEPVSGVITIVFDAPKPAA